MRLSESTSGLPKKEVSKSGKGGIFSQQENYQVIEEFRALHGVTRLLSIAGIPRASYYKWRATRSQHIEKQTRDHEIKEHMMAIHSAHPYFGYPRLMTTLWEQAIVSTIKK